LIQFTTLLLTGKYDYYHVAMDSCIPAVVLQVNCVTVHMRFVVSNFKWRYIYVFCTYLTTNSDLCHLQHKLIGFHNRMKSIYFAVQTGSLNKTVCVSSLNGYMCTVLINHFNPTGYVMHKQFNIQQVYALPTLYLCVLYLSENKQRLVPLTA